MNKELQGKGVLEETIEEYRNVYPVIHERDHRSAHLHDDDPDPTLRTWVAIWNDADGYTWAEEY